MANAAGWNPADKNVGITLSSALPYLGVNSILSVPSASGQIAARSVWSASSGKWIIYMLPNSKGGSAVFGVGNASANLAAVVGSDGNSYGIAGSVLIHLGSIATIPAFSFFPGFYGQAINPVLAMALNLDASPPRLHFRQVVSASSGAPRGDSGWIDAGGSASDPTNDSSGTDIGALGFPVYVMGSGDNTGSPFVVQNINMGGWVPPVEFIPIPAGYGMPDANYPGAIPAGTFTLSSNSAPSVVTVTQGGMRGHVPLAASGGTGGNLLSSPFPAGSLTINAVYWDILSRSGADNGHGFARAGAAYRWNNDGSTSFGGAGTGPTWGSGDVTHSLVNMVTKKAWFTADGGATFWGNGGPSPNPATGVNGFDFSADADPANLAPQISLQSDWDPMATWNAGLTEDPFAVAGFRWLEQPYIPSRLERHPRRPILMR